LDYAESFESYQNSLVLFVTWLNEGRYGFRDNFDHAAAR
jgi:hypothetical protein